MQTTLTVGLRAWRRLELSASCPVESAAFFAELQQETWRALSCTGPWAAHGMADVGDCDCECDCDCDCDAAEDDVGRERGRRHPGGSAACPCHHHNNPIFKISL